MPGVPGFIDATSNDGLIPAGVCVTIGVAPTVMPNTINPNNLIFAPSAVLYRAGSARGGSADHLQVNRSSM
jgi:hypothetical protein